MLRRISIAALTVLGFAGITRPAEAGHKNSGIRVSFGVGIHGSHLRVGYRHGPTVCPRAHHVQGHRHHRGYAVKHRRHLRGRHHAHAHRCYQRKVWVEPRYRQVFVGYDAWGRPVYSHAVVASGYYRTVWSCH